MRSLDQWLKNNDYTSEVYFQQSELLIKIIYYFWSFFTIHTVLRFLLNRFNHLELLVSPLWPIFWAGESVSQAEALIICAIFIFGVLQSILFFKYPISRIICFATTLIGLGLIFSGGKINHGYHGWIFTLFVFCFLPDQWTRAKQEFVKVFYYAQWFVILPYFLSGLWKLRMISKCYFSDSANCVIGEQVMRLTLLKEEITAGGLPAGGQLLLDYPFLGMMGFYSVILLQLSSLFFVFYRRWINVLGFLLIGFHVLTEVVLGPSFYPQVYLLVLILCSSPWLKRIDEEPVFAV